MAKHQPVVEQLKTLLDGNKQMTADLLASLNKAVDLAKNGGPDNKPPKLNDALYHAIDTELKSYGWPTTIEDYYNYLDNYVTLVPNEFKGTHYAWTSDGTKNGYNQKFMTYYVSFTFW